MLFDRFSFVWIGMVGYKNVCSDFDGAMSCR